MKTLNGNPNQILQPDTISISTNHRDMFKKMSLRQEFNPTTIGIWVNSCYLIRRIISEAIKENAHNLKGVILDYGCGSKPYENFFDSTQYIGIDIETSGYPDIHKKADVFFDGTNLPFKDHQFDGVLASEVFEHVFNLEVCLAEIFRVLKPSGRLLITCPFVWPLHEEPYDFARYTPHALTQILHQAGFEILTLQKKGAPAEVIGQMFVLEILPQVLSLLNRRPFRRLHNILNALIRGLIFIISRVFSGVSSGREQLYLTNVLVVEKIAFMPFASK